MDHMITGGQTPCEVGGRGSFLLFLGITGGQTPCEVVVMRGQTPSDVVQKVLFAAWASRTFS